MDHFRCRRIVKLLCAAGILGFTSYAYASAFQLWEQDGATVGNYHAGYAAEADNASTTFYNPAGIVRIKHQQASLAGVFFNTNMQYRGTVNLNPYLDEPAQYTTAQGGNFAALPALNYVTPLTDKLGFGFNINVPFGLKTNYGNDTIVRYATTQASVTVIDYSPSFAYQVTDKGSLGLGLDIQRMYMELDECTSFDLSTPELDTMSVNKINDTAYGFHAGALYEITPDARVGLSYHSKVVHHLTGSSQFTGPMANATDFGGPYSSSARANVTLPPYTALSAFYKIHPQWSVMASAILTQWSITGDNLVLNGLSGLQGGVQSQSIQVMIPQHYRDTWNFAAGADYYVNETYTVRGGLGYDQTPVRDAYRNIGLPDNNRIITALGGHMQAWKTVGFDVGWLHVFGKNAPINPPPEVTGDQIVETNGTVRGGANVFSGQVTWDMT